MSYSSDAPTGAPSANMQAANRLQNVLKAGKKAFGAWQVGQYPSKVRYARRADFAQGFPGSNLSRVLARTPGIDWICIDCEHGNVDDGAMHESVAAVAACGVSPIVRVPEGQHWMIKRALDAGAHGIIVPLLETVEDAQRIAKFSKFPPKGNRGLGGALAMEKFVSGKTGEVGEISMADYYRDANDATLVCVQIETKSALSQVDAIAAVEGIDVLLVGPNDLGNQLGHPMILNGGKISPELEEAIQKVNKAAHDAGKKSAIYMGSGEMAKQYADTGFDMVNAINDIMLMKMGAASAIATAMGKK